MVAELLNFKIQCDDQNWTYLHGQVSLYTAGVLCGGQQSDGAAAAAYAPRRFHLVPEASREIYFHHHKSLYPVAGH